MIFDVVLDKSAKEADGQVHLNESNVDYILQPIINVQPEVLKSG